MGKHTTSKKKDRASQEPIIDIMQSFKSKYFHTENSHDRYHTIRQALYVIVCYLTINSSYYCASVANVPNVLQPPWLIVLPLDVPDLTASLLL